MATKAKPEVTSDMDRIEVVLVDGPRPYLWLGIDGRCVDTFEGANLRRLVKALDGLLHG